MLCYPRKARPAVWQLKINEAQGDLPEEARGVLHCKTIDEVYQVIALYKATAWSVKFLDQERPEQIGIEFSNN